MTSGDLSKSTSRLLISAVDDSDDPRKQVSQFLKLHAQGPEEAIDDNDSVETNPSHLKRRRSSALSASLPKAQKPHKKKLQKLSESPQIVIDSTRTGSVSFKSLREVILNAYGAHHWTSNGNNKWIDPTKLKGLKNTTVVFAPGLQLPIERKDDQLTLPINEVETSNLPFFDNFEYALASQCPGSKDLYYSPVQTLIYTPLNKKEKKEMLAKLAETPITIMDLLMTPIQRRSQRYPEEGGEGWIRTNEFEHEGSHIFALDCEFCQAKSGSVLTRVSMVNFQGEVVLDEFVKPEEEIIDYVTKYSGITAEKLEGVTTTLKDMQLKICSIVLASDILIGHSLELDLDVLQILHDKVVDTSVIYEHVKGPPLKPSLRWLAQKFLERSIQNGESTGEGHSSVEDAQACLDLVKAKIQNGMCFGLNVSEVSTFRRLASVNPGFKSLFVGYSPYEQNKYEDDDGTKMFVHNDDEVVDAIVSAENKARFNVACLQELEYNLRWLRVPDHFNGKLYSKEADVSNDSFQLTEDQRKDLYTRMNDRIAKIYDALPEKSMLVVFSTTGAPFELQKMQEAKRRYQQLDKDGHDLSKLPREEQWDIDKQQLLYRACTSAKSALTFLKIKLL